MSRSFTPGPTSKITVSASSQRLKLVEQSSPQQVRVCNLGTATVWLAFGDGTVTATTAGIPVPGNEFTEVMTIPPEATHVAAIAAGSTGDIAFTLGVGI